MRGESMSGITVTGTTLLRLALMCHLFRGFLLSLEVLGHKCLNLSFSDLREVLEVETRELEVGVTFSDLEVPLSDQEVVSDLTIEFCDLEGMPREEEVVAMDLAVVVLSPVGWTPNDFLLVVLVPPRSIGALLLTLS